MPRKNDIDIGVGVEGAPQTKRELDKVRKGVKDVGKSTKKTATANKGLAKSFGSVLTSMKSFFIGAFSIAALTKAYRSWRAEIESTIDAQNTLAESNLSLQQSAKRLADQLGILNAAGLKIAEQAIKAVVRAGPTLGFTAAESLTKGVASAFEISGGIGQRGIGISKAIAEFASVKGLSEPEIAQLTKVLAQVSVSEGVKPSAATPKQIQQSLAQISKAGIAASSAAFGPFITAVSKAFPEIKAVGGTFPEFAAALVPIVGETGSDIEAAEVTKQVSRLLGQPKLIKAAAANQGISEAEFRNQPFTQRYNSMLRFIREKGKTLKGQQLLEETLEPTQLARARAVATPASFAKGRAVLAEQRLITPATFGELFAPFRGTPLATQERVEAETLLAGSVSTQEQNLGKRLLELAEAKRVQNQAAGKGQIFASDMLERERIAFQIFREQQQAAIGLLSEAGDIEMMQIRQLISGGMFGAADVSVPITERGREFRQWQIELAQNRPSRIGDFTPLEVGALQRGITAIAPSVNINYWFNHGGDPTNTRPEYE